jgi:sugar/nucleoside kinase (ribokinase family)
VTLGGTVAYAGLTASALGAEVGIVTACAADVDLKPLMTTDLITFPSEQTTTFSNLERPQGRAQKISARARTLSLDMLPTYWRNAEILHLAPVADEIDLDALDQIASASLFITPQGWLRAWDESGRIIKKSWQHISDILSLCHSAVCSAEDLDNDPAAARGMASQVPLLVITRSGQGATLYLNGKEHVIEAMRVDVADSTGSGDIFAAVFFFEIQSGSDPHDAALRANYLAGCSVTRRWLESIPTQSEIERARGNL